MSKTSEASSNPPLILVDGSSYLFRAFHALPQLTTSNGQPTGAIKGVVSMLLKLQKEYQPTHMAVVFDAKGKTFRNDLYSEYKANRPPMPDELRQQIEPLHELVKSMGLPLLVIEGVEADDVIGTLAHQAQQKGIDTLISTGDKDMAQLVNEHVTLINTMNESVTDKEGVKEKFGVRPDQIIDYLALMGDKVDNIPGVNKCGPKTAVKWLSEYDTLENLMANAEAIKGKIGENLREAAEKLPLSKELATIVLDVDLDVGLDDLKVNEADQDSLIQHYKELEFKTWLSDLLDGSDAEPDMKIEYETVTTKEAFNQWMKALESAEYFAFDTETSALDYMVAELVGLSFAVEPGKAAYVPVAHDYPGAPDQLDRDWVLEQLKPLLESSPSKIIGQHLKYDMNVLVKYDIHIPGPAFDTMLESYVLDSTATRHDMDSLALKYLGIKTVHFEDIAGKGAKQLTFNQIPLEQSAHYAAEDADITLRLHQALWPKLQREQPLDTVLQDIDLPLVPVLAKMEQHGTLLDVAKLREQSTWLAKRMQELEAKAHELAGGPFNLGSPKQLGEVLYEKLNLPVLKKTPKGAPSTAEPVLQDLARDYELPAVIMDYRSVSKLKSTYTDKLPLQVFRDTNRVHTSYHQAVAATGRLSSSDPNLQNIPIRNEEGRKIRQAFIAPPGYKLVAADYSQIELRIMAHLSGDEGLQKAFAEGQDIHSATASEVFATALDEVSSEQRRNAKAINFGLIYGMSAFGLSNQLGIPQKEAQSYIDRYFERYPGVHQFMETIKEKAAEQGYVETLFGRRLYLPEIRAQNMQRRKAAERLAINAPMQGTAADIIKKAMINVDSWLTEQQLNTKMIMQVHDELVFEVPEEELDTAIEGIRQRMDGAADLKVPLLVDVGIGDNWDEAH